MAVQPDYRSTTGAPGWGRTATADAAAVDAGLRAYMLRVFNWMASGLLLTGIVAYVIGSNPDIQAMFWEVTRTASGARSISATMLGWVAMLSPLAFVLVLSFGINKLSTVTAQALYWAFCVAMGASLTTIFLVYTHESIVQVFFIAAGTFAAMSVYGYTTRRDLTKLGSFCIMGLFGVIIASLANMFIGSSGMGFIVSIVGVLVFVGLTAWDTQRIKSDYVNFTHAYGQDMAAKRSVIDSLGLLLNFINLFLLMLNLFGNRSGR